MAILDQNFCNILQEIIWDTTKIEKLKMKAQSWNVKLHYDVFYVSWNKKLFYYGTPKMYKCSPSD